MKWSALIFVFGIVFFLSLTSVSGATWGNISEGDDAEIILNSPEDNEIVFTPSVSFNATANVTGGATIVNMSLWYNGTGTWHRNQTSTEGVTTSYTIGEDSASSIWGDNGQGQTFEYISSMTVGYISLKLSKSGTPSGTINVSIWNTDGAGNPTTLIAKNDTIDPTTLSGSSTEYNISFNSFPILNADTEYAYTIFCDTCTDGNQLNLFGDATGPTYSDGFLIASGDAGSSWTPDTDQDHIFKIGSLFGITPTRIFTTTISNPTLWGIEACDSDGACGFSENRTVLLDATPPLIEVTTSTPIDYYRLYHYLNISVSVTDLGLDSCWYDYSNTNVSFTCTNDLQVNVTDYSNSNITIYANDTAGNVNTTFFDWDYKLFSWSQTFVASYETARETFSELITALNAITSAELFYATVSQGSSTVTNEGGGNYTISDIVALTSAEFGTNSFYWNITTNGEVIRGDSSDQTVAGANLSLCGGEGGSVSYLNFTFKDEVSGLVINASNDLSDFDYGLSTSTQTKSFISTNTTEHDSYAFCFTPPSETVYVDATFKYSKDSYQIRTFKLADVILTNDTTNQVLYLLGSSDGIYTTIQTATSLGSPISGVTVVVERQFSGTWTIVELGVSGTDGGSTFWVNPNFDHRLTATKVGFATTQVTIRPSQSTYTLIMTETTSNATYVSDIPGVKWVAYPRPGTIQSGSHNFNVTVTASNSNLENCKFELLNATNTSQILATSTSFTNSTYCQPSFDYIVIKDVNFFGRLYIDTTSTDGFVIVDTDWKWVAIDLDIKGWRTITSFFGDLKDLSEFGEGNEREFSRYIFFFLLMTIFLAVFFHFSGFELSNPGSSILLIWFIVLVASVSGFLSFDSGSDNINEVWEQYAFLLMFSLLSVGYMLNKWRKDNE